MSEKSATFAGDLENEAMTIETSNILGIIISIRLQGVGGSDKACV